MELVDICQNLLFLQDELRWLLEFRRHESQLRVLPVRNKQELHKYPADYVWNCKENSSVLTFFSRRTVVAFAVSASLDFALLILF